MYSIEHLSHTADIRLRLSADSQEELFRAGLETMNEIIVPGACQKPCPRITYCKIALTAHDETSLFIDFLSEVLTLTHNEKTLFCEVSFEELSGTAIAATVGGRRVNGFEEDIKAVTYHEAEIRQNPDGNWTTMLIFDI